MTRCHSKQVLSHVGAKDHHFLCFKQYYRFMNTTCMVELSRTKGLPHRSPVVYPYGTALPFLNGQKIYVYDILGQGVVCPCPGAIYMYMTIILKHLL